MTGLTIQMALMVIPKANMRTARGRNDEIAFRDIVRRAEAARPKRMMSLRPILSETHPMRGTETTWPMDLIPMRRPISVRGSLYPH